MAFGQSLKVAASELRRAAMQAKQEADELQRSLVNRENELNKKIAGLRAENIIDRAASANIYDEATSRLLERDLDRTEQKITDMRKEYEKEKAALKDKTQELLQQQTQLTNEAAELERKASIF